jgi:hypothetical protein
MSSSNMKTVWSASEKKPNGTPGENCDTRVHITLPRVLHYA